MSILRFRRFTEWGKPLHWIAFPVKFLTKACIHWMPCCVNHSEKHFSSLITASSHPLFPRLHSNFCVSEVLIWWDGWPHCFRQSFSSKIAIDMCPSWYGWFLMVQGHSLWTATRSNPWIIHFCREPAAVGNDGTKKNPKQKMGGEKRYHGIESDYTSNSQQLLLRNWRACKWIFIPRALSPCNCLSVIS